MRPLTHALPGALAALLRDVPLTSGMVDFAWAAAVGAAVQRVTSVRLDRRVLIVEVPDQNWDREITRSTPVILARLQRLLGRDVVTEIQIRKHPR
jgi:predicted nucleic acid-binding Zn ribbon protein